MEDISVRKRYVKDNVIQGDAETNPRLDTEGPDP